MQWLTRLFFALALAVLSACNAHAAGPFTYYAQNHLIDYLFRGQASGTPSTWYVALYTVCPTDTAGSGTEVANANAYADHAVALFAAEFAAFSNSDSNSDPDFDSDCG